ncbi:MAG TPA: VWA domain-containing protein, partial [Candidatus Binataceae bacterium]|nr:VWA domain-containing protein [Candidatus Binataceae bacterium]
MFDRPALLWLLLLAPIVAWPSVMAIRRAKIFAGALSLVLRLACLTVMVAVLAGLRVNGVAAARRLELVALLDHSGSIAADQRDWMRARLSAVRAALTPGDQLAVIAFARDARLVSPLSDPRLLRESGASPDPGATDLESALTAAQSLFSPDADKRILLLSDGNQTEGDAATQVPALREDAIRVFAAAPPPSSAHRVALTDFEAPPAVRARSQFSFALAIESESPEPADAQLRLLADGVPVGGRHVELKAGLNRFELPYRIDKPGAYLMAAELAVAPPLDAINPRAEVALSVSAPPRVLVASESRPESLITALKLRGFDTDLVSPRSLSPLATDYLSYQLVVLDDAASGELLDTVQQALNRYVADYGGGLVVTGETLRDDHFRGGALEKALPVRFEQQPPPPTREPIAVYLCIDRSNSMSYDSRYPAVRDCERIRYAKQAAIALLRQLDDSDYAGVIAFDSEPYVLGHLQALGDDRADLEARIERLQPGGGTDFKEALEIAEREILQSGVAVRQVILLT